MASRNRGKKRRKLRDLSVAPLTDAEKTALVDALTAGSNPITTAVLGAVTVEHELDSSLRRKLRTRDDSEWEGLVEERGPLSSLYAKIVLGHTLRLYNEKTMHDLHVLRAIRNAFAHSKRVIDFDYDLILNELNSAHVLTKKDKKLIPAASDPSRAARLLYVCLSLRLAVKFMTARTRAINRRQRRSKWSPLAEALLRTLPPKDAGESRPTSYLLGQSGDPKNLAPPTTPLGLYGLGSILARSEDKKK